MHESVRGVRRAVAAITVAALAGGAVAAAPAQPSPPDLEVRTSVLEQVGQRLDDHRGLVLHALQDHHPLVDAATVVDGQRAGADAARAEQGPWLDVAPVGDVDGDGTADLAAAAPDEVLLLDGGRGDVLATIPLDATSGARIEGLGTDLDGDGAQDLVAVRVLDHQEQVSGNCLVSCTIDRAWTWAAAWRGSATGTEVALGTWPATSHLVLETLCAGVYCSIHVEADFRDASLVATAHATVARPATGASALRPADVPALVTIQTGDVAFTEDYESVGTFPVVYQRWADEIHSSIDLDGIGIDGTARWSRAGELLAAYTFTDDVPRMTASGGAGIIVSSLEGLYGSQSECLFLAVVANCPVQDRPDDASSITAIDTRTGAEVWTRQFPDELVAGLAAGADVDLDGTADVLAVGLGFDAEDALLQGSTGELALQTPDLPGVAFTNYLGQRAPGVSVFGGVTFGFGADSQVVAADVDGATGQTGPIRVVSLPQHICREGGWWSMGVSLGTDLDADGISDLAFDLRSECDGQEPEQTFGLVSIGRESVLLEEQVGVDDHLGVVADLTGDGLVDLYRRVPGGDVTLLDTATFADLWVPAHLFASTPVDHDGDGQHDLVAIEDGAVTVRHGRDGAVRWSTAG